MREAVMRLADLRDPGLGNQFDWIGMSVFGWYKEGKAEHPAVRDLMQTLKERADDILKGMNFNVYHSWWWPEEEPIPKGR